MRFALNSLLSCALLGNCTGLTAWCSSYNEIEIKKPCEIPIGNSTRVSVMTYNLNWWNLFERQGGGHAASLLSSASLQDPWVDVIAFQECGDITRVLSDAGLSASYQPVESWRGLSLIYKTSMWNMLESGKDDVAEDAPSQYYGRRSILWMRLRHTQTNRVVAFVTHHGPLPVNSGGRCGGVATGRRILQSISRLSQTVEALILMGDFNANVQSETLAVLQGDGNGLHRVVSGSAYGGVDHIFTRCESSVGKTLNFGNGGSDHDAMGVVLQL